MEELRALAEDELEMMDEKNEEFRDDDQIDQFEKELSELDGGN